MIHSHLYLLLSYDLQTFGFPQCAHLLNVPSVRFMNWSDDGSMSRNMLPDLQTDDKTICCVPTEYNNIYFIIV